MQSSNVPVSGSPQTVKSSARPPAPKAAGESSWLEISWPIVALFTMYAIFAVSTQLDYTRMDKLADQAHSAMANWTAKKTARPPDRVLIVTANPDRQMQVIATLSPRGFEPLLAMSLAEVKSQIESNHAALRMAVLDANVHDSARIAGELEGSLPAGQIVVIQRSSSREAIGQMLIDRL